jgi:hypothetical protein
VAHQLGGGDHGEWAGRGEKVAQWRWARQTRPGGKYGAEEVVWRGNAKEAVGDRARRAGDQQWRGVGWVDRHSDAGRKRRREHRGERIGSMDKRRVRK